MGHPRETNLPHDMGLPRPELAGRETGRGFTAGGGASKVGRAGREMGRGIYHRQVGTGRQGDGKRNLPQEMGHPRETNLPHDMGLPRPELAGRETEEDLLREVGHPRWEVAGREMGRGIYHSRWELAGRETGRGILPQRWDIQGRRIYHMTWDFQDRNWQVGRREEDLPREVGHPRWEVAGREMGRGIYHSRWELAGRETGRGILPQEMGIQDGNWQIGRREEEFTAGDGTSKGDEFTT